MLAPLGSGQLEKGVARNGGKAIAQKSQPRVRAQQSAEQQAANSLESEVSEIRQQLAKQQQLAQELETTKTEQDVAIQKELVKYTRWLVIAGFIQFIALIVQAVIFFRTLRTMNRQAQDLQKQTIATETAANAARDNTQVLLNSERAWILVETGGIPDNFESNQNSMGFLDIRPIIRNSGKTPGWITRGFIRYYLVPAGSQLPPEPDYRGNLAEQQVNIVLAPNGFIQALYVSIPFSVFVPVRQGSQTLYIYGFVDYTVFPNETRQSRFCIQYHVQSGFDSQTRGFYMAVNVPAAYTQCT
jgi:hypothetical protein